jgi:recombinational DNA repair protein RecT
MQSNGITQQDKTLALFNNKEYQEKILNILPKDAPFTATQFLAIVRNEILANTKLAECKNLTNILYDIASAGLMLGSMYDEAYIIPYNANATFICGYKGYVRKYNEAGYRVSVLLYSKEDAEDGRVVHDEILDLWHIKKDPLKMTKLSRENIMGGVIKLIKNNVISACEHMTVEEIIETSATKQWDNGKPIMKLSSVWNSKDRWTDFGEMAKKALIRKVSKRVSLHAVNNIVALENNSLNLVVKETSKLQTVTNIQEIDIETNIPENVNDIMDSKQKEFEEKRQQEIVASNGNLV